MIPHTTPPVYPAGIADSRLAARVHSLAAGCRIGLLGLPDDTGVRLNHGRPGAAAGPTAFRAAFAKYGVAEPFGVTIPKVFDAGDLVPVGGGTETALHETHARVTEAASALLDLGLFPIAIGGGHDLSFPFIRAVAQRSPDLGLLYFDAHLDVRDTVGSGMPFRRLIENCRAGPAVCVGMNAFANTAEHVAWFRSHGGHVVELHEGVAESEMLFGPLATSSSLAVSFDLDCLDAAHAPGVQRLNPAGLSVREAERLVGRACSDPRTRCFDLMELCPAQDDQSRTARVAVHLFLSALAALAARERVG